MRPLAAVNKPGRKGRPAPALSKSRPGSPARLCGVRRTQPSRPGGRGTAGSPRAGKSPYSQVTPRLAAAVPGVSDPGTPGPSSAGSALQVTAHPVGELMDLLLSSRQRGLGPRGAGGGPPLRPAGLPARARRPRCPPEMRHPEKCHDYRPLQPLSGSSPGAHYPGRPLPTQPALALADARKEAEQIIAHARQEAGQIIADGHERAQHT
jgi:hypothetical protein